MGMGEVHGAQIDWEHPKIHEGRGGNPVAEPIEQSSVIEHFYRTRVQTERLRKPRRFGKLLQNHGLDAGQSKFTRQHQSSRTTPSYRYIVHRLDLAVMVIFIMSRPREFPQCLGSRPDQSLSRTVKEQATFSIGVGFECR